MRRLGLAISITLAIVASHAAGQSRKQVTIGESRVTIGRKIGPSTDFQSYSYGLGSLSSRSAPLQNNPLQSSIQSNITSPLRSSLPQQLNSGITSPAAFSVRQQSYLPPYGTAGTKLPSSPASTTGNVWTNPLSTKTGVFAPGKVTLPGNAASLPPGLGKTPVQTAPPPPTPVTQAQVPITSLAPSSDAGPYRDYIVMGEQSFRQGDFATAASQFKLANYIAPRDPGNLLNLLHVQFAQANYIQAAATLRTVLAVLPELPLSSLSPRGFYGEPDDFYQHLDMLKNYVANYSQDPNGHFLLGYFLWFDNAHQQAVESMDQALQISERHLAEASGRQRLLLEERIDAIRTFLQAAAMSGKLGRQEQAARAAQTVVDPNSLLPQDLM